jgi:hypothetical protein
MRSHGIVQLVCSAVSKKHANSNLCELDLILVYARLLSENFLTMHTFPTLVRHLL